VTTKFLWCGERICEARDSSDNVLARYYAQGERHGSTIAYYAQDQVGSVVATVDPQGQVAARLKYDSYGTITSSNGTLPDYRYAGLYAHPQSGVYLATYRAYDPKIGRWLSRDPIRELGGLNLYGYVGGNPILWNDPDGLLFGVNAGESYGDSAAQYWANQYIHDTGLTAGFDALMGGLASLWTPCTSDATATVLAGGVGIGRYFGRAFWQYFPAENPGYSSPWMTRGWGWKPPYSPGTEAAKKLALSPYNSATAVRPISPSPFKYVGGPRTVQPQPQWGQPGGGVEYRFGGFK
jgi:RHS repeat-associated protein